MWEGRVIRRQRRGESKKRALAEECRRENKAEEKKNKEQSTRETETEGEKINTLP